MILYTLLFLVISIKAETFTSKVFLSADSKLYTADYCRSLKAVPFLAAIRDASAAPTAEKQRAFDALFNGCREEFLAADLAPNYAVYLLLTGNEEFLSSLLRFKDAGKLKLTPEQFQNLGTIVYAAAPPDQRDRLFALKAPHRALALILAHCDLVEGRVEDQLQLLKNYVEGHWAHREETYRDFGAVQQGTQVLEYYLKHPGDLGARKAEVIEAIEARYGRTRSGSNWASWCVVGALIVVMVGAILILPHLTKEAKQKLMNKIEK